MYGPYSDYWGWGMGNMMGWFGGGIMMIAFWVLLVVILVWIAREVGNKNSHPDSNAPDTLKKRYAKGEIDKREIEEKNKDKGIQ